MDVFFFCPRSPGSAACWCGASSPPRPSARCSSRATSSSGGGPRLMSTLCRQAAHRLTIGCRCLRSKGVPCAAARAANTRPAASRVCVMAVRSAAGCTYACKAGAGLGSPGTTQQGDTSHQRGHGMAGRRHCSSRAPAVGRWGRARLAGMLLRRHQSPGPTWPPLDTLQL